MIHSPFIFCKSSRLQSLQGNHYPTSTLPQQSAPLTGSKPKSNHVELPPGRLSSVKQNSYPLQRRKLWLLQGRLNSALSGSRPENDFGVAVDSEDQIRDICRSDLREKGWDPDGRLSGVEMEMEGYQMCIVGKVHFAGKVFWKEIQNFSRSNADESWLPYLMPSSQGTVSTPNVQGMARGSVNTVQPGEFRLCGIGLD